MLDGVDFKPVADLVVSVVNHSRPDLLAQCLESLFATTTGLHLEVWVIDNGTDLAGVPEMQGAFPQVQWIFNGRRQGFSSNHNQVLSRAKGHYFCILNDDTIIHAGALGGLISFMEEHPNVGIAGPTLLNRDGSLQASTFHFMPAIYQLIELCWLPPPLVKLKALGSDPCANESLADEPRRVDWLLGACLVVRQETLSDVGLLDEWIAPIANMEDIDLCRRAAQLGWEAWFVPSAVVTHYGGQSLWMARSGVDSMRVEMMRANLRYYLRHGGTGSAALVALLYVLTVPWNIVMLLQMAIRRRIAWAAAAREVMTATAIARTGFQFLTRRALHEAGRDAPRRQCDRTGDGAITSVVES